MTVPVLYIIDKLHRAGAQNNLFQLASGLDRSRFAPAVCSLARGGDLASALEARGVEVTVLGLERIYTPKAWRAFRRLVRSMRARRTLLVQSYLDNANLFGSLAARKAGVPVVLTSRRDMGFARLRRLRFLEEIVVNPRVTGVVTPCEGISELTRKERGLADKVVTIPNGVDAAKWKLDPGERSRARDELGLSAEAPAVGVVANFLRVKGHADFLEAAARVAGTHPSAKFLLVGDGALRGELETLSAKLGLRDRTVFTGPRGDTPRLMAALDVFVLPSHSEGMSNVLLEAMAMARPVVATAVGGNPEVVEHERSGLLVAPRDPDALASSILRLLADREQAERLGREAERRIRRHFTLKKMIQRYQHLYEELLSAYAEGAPDPARAAISS